MVNVPRIPGFGFAHMEAPRGMKTSMMGVFFCSLGVGTYLGLGLTSIAQKYSEFLNAKFLWLNVQIKI